VRIKVAVFQVLEKFFERLEDWAKDKRMHFAICPDCGRNRYTGAPCVKFPEQREEYGQS
jgi:hypothetical protein